MPILIGPSPSSAESLSAPELMQAVSARQEAMAIPAMR